ncbi:hypothetical protein [Xanthomonas graminis]|uniref:hypothetical protein n=1 Tax=Xanthomonas graminis TaxID=3390026 RepID=UPI000B2A984F|nr:hypothetical protein [Xanthomonas translucens]
MKEWLLLCPFLLGACSQTEDAALQSSDKAEQPAHVEEASSSKKEETMSPLEGVLLKFIAAKPPTWDAFNAVSSVKWRDSGPLKNDDASDAQSSYYRRGNLLLSGFGMVDVPDGAQDADAGARQENEGNAGVTLNGDAGAVHSIAVQKFYVSDNYKQVLSNQISSSDSLGLIADRCDFDYGTSSQNTQKNQFFQLNFSAGKVYAEVYIDDGAESHGPGSTTFVFYLSKPTQRIASMQCKEK